MWRYVQPRRPPRAELGVSSLFLGTEQAVAGEYVDQSLQASLPGQLKGDPRGGTVSSPSGKEGHPV